jgi:hypothetical protein
MAILTDIVQHEVKILSAKDFDRYDYNKPGANWELIEYVDFKDKDNKPLRSWVGKHQLQYPEFRDKSKLTIVESN